MARSDPQVNFRIPAALNNRLKEAAALNNRTVTAELVSRLEASFAEDTSALAGPNENLREVVMQAMRDAMEAIVRLKSVDQGKLADLLDLPQNAPVSSSRKRKP